MGRDHTIQASFDVFAALRPTSGADDPGREWITEH
jgi:hypothetical protein